MARHMLEAIMIGIVEYFIRNGASGQHCKVLLQAPFTDKETEAKGPSLPSPPHSKLAQLADLLYV